MTEKPDCERFVRLAVYPRPTFVLFLFLFIVFSPFFRHPEVPAFFVQFDGPARALSRTSKYQRPNTTLPETHGNISLQDDLNIFSAHDCTIVLSVNFAGFQNLNLRMKKRCM